MHGNPMDPESCLRSLTAEALTRAQSDEVLLPVSLGLQAVANAFVMLGLLPEARAEAILAEHRSALERRGFGNAWGVTKGELTVRPGAHDYWEARTAGPAGLRDIPLSVAATGICCPTSVADVYFDWVTLTAAGVRLRFHATSADANGSAVAQYATMQQAMSEISLIDDTRHSYSLTIHDADWSRTRERQEWHGQVIADQNPAGRAAWLEFTPVKTGLSGRVVMPPSARVVVGTSDPPWPTPAECYLAALAPVTSISINQAKVGPEHTAQIVAVVADSLMAVGALPVASTLLREFPGSGKPSWYMPLIDRWGRRARQRAADVRPAEYLGLAVLLPLEHATAVIEGVSAQGDLVTVQLYGHPWLMGEYWPMITPCFQVGAIDEAGNEHDGIPDSWHGAPDQAGSGRFWFWPPINPAHRSLRVTVSTLWEAAWAEVKLPPH